MTRSSPPPKLKLLKNSFYSSALPPDEAAQLTAIPAAGLEHEIVLLRVLIHRTLLLAGDLHDLDEATRLLEALGSTAGRLAKLVQINKNLSTLPSNLADEISVAIQQANAELRHKA